MRGKKKLIPDGNSSYCTIGMTGRQKLFLQAIDKLPLQIINPLRIDYKDTDILYCKLHINGSSVGLNVIYCPYRGSERVKMKSLRYRMEVPKIESIAVEIVKKVGECVTRKEG